MHTAIARHGYFALQRLRGGVQPSMITKASALLECPWPEIETYISKRLEAVHGSSAASPSWLAKQRLVTRTELIPRMRELLASQPNRQVEHRKTSGSTGVPFRFVKARQMTAQMDAAMWAVYAWHGVRPGDPQARFWGAPTVRRLRAKRRFLDYVQNRRRLSAFEVQPRNSLHFFESMRRFSPAYAYGYPTLLSTFVQHCLHADLDGRELQLCVVICTGEILIPAVRKQLEQFFGCRVVNEYGCTESGIIACECESGTMHRVPVAALGEIVGETGAPVGPGQTGEVVVTDLYGDIAPLVRYRLHDRATASTQSSCPCGRELPAIELQQGRLDSFIKTPHRGPVYDAILAYTVPPEVLRFRVHQLAIDHLKAEIMPGAGFDPQHTPESCRDRWEHALGPGVTVSVETVQDIPLTAAGKLRYFVPMSEESHS